MTTDSAAQILLVRAIEEAEGVEIPPGARIDALEAAGDLDDERDWFARRAAYLLEHPLVAYRPLLGVRSVLAPRLGAILGVGLVLGLSSNYLGPRSRIHVLYNPIALLILWNLGIYAATALANLWPLVRGRAPALETGSRATEATEGSVADIVPARPRAVRAPRGPGGLLGRWLRRWASDLWLRLHRRAMDAGERARELSAVGMRFSSLWEQAARPLFGLSARRALHVGAVGIAVGAVAGMIVRGLFFDYAMVWRSTFIREPETVATLLRLLLGPAAALLGWPAPDAASASALMTPEGVGAERWIWLYAVTTFGAVVAPRSALAAWCAWRARRLGNAIDLRLDDPYYTRILQQAREIQVGRLKQEIGSAVRVESGKFAEGLAVFVAEGLYDERIAPRLGEFRQQGGRIAELEERIRKECEAFDAELREHLPRAQAEFERALTAKVVDRVGRELGIPHASAQRLESVARQIPGGSVAQLGGSVSAELTRPVSRAVTTAVALVAGSVSGGFGQSLGMALLVALFGTTGPVGFLIGALVGLATAGGALWLGRDRMQEGVKRVDLPGVVVRTALRKQRFERLVAEGRERCLATVRGLTTDKLEPLTDEMADQIWRRVKPVLAEAAGPGPRAAARGD